MAGRVNIEALLANSDSDSDDQSASGMRPSDLEALLEDDDDDDLDEDDEDDVNALLGSDTESEADSDGAGSPIKLASLSKIAPSSGPKEQQELPAAPAATSTNTVRTIFATTTGSLKPPNSGSSLSPAFTAQKESNEHGSSASGRANQEPAASSSSSSSMDPSRRSSILNASAGGAGGGSDTQFGALDMAERREQRHFHASIRDAPTALKVKRGKRSGAALAAPTGSKGAAGSAAAGAGSGATQLGAASSSLKFAFMDMISSQLKRNASYKQHGPGTATAMHVNPKFFVVGTSNGLLLVFDFLQEIRQVMGSNNAAGTRCLKAVTAIDMTPAGNLVVCGYSSGEIALWDVFKGTILKRVTDLHRRRVSQLQFIRGAGEALDTSAAAVEFWTVSADAGGSANRGFWSKSMWSNYNADFDCLIDGSAGAVPALHVLAPIAEWNLDRAGGRAAVSKENKIPKKSATGAAEVPVVVSVTEGLVVPVHMQPLQLLAFDTLSRSYIVQVQPVIRVLHRWAAPPVAEGAVRERVSCLHWSWTTCRHYPAMSSRQPYASHPDTAAPVLARAWGMTAEVLWVTCTPVPGDLKFEFETVASSIQDGNVLSLRWLDEDRLVILTQRTVSVVNQHLTVLERCELTAQVAVSVQAAAEASHAGKVDDSTVSSLFSRERYVYVLGPESMARLHLQSWVEQADQLVHEGRWLEALALALDEGGYVTEGPSGSSTGSAKSEQVASYVHRYAELALTQGGKSAPAAMQMQSHYQLVSAVCLEFCFACGNLTLLFGSLYDIFVKARQQLHFLDALEAHIMLGDLDVLPTRILVDLFEFFAKNQRMSALERCVVHMTILPEDLDFTSAFLLRRGMSSGFLNVWARGLGDHAGAFVCLVEHLLQFESRNGSSNKRSSSPAPTVAGSMPLTPEQIEIGYKLLLFVRYTALGKVFPIDPAANKPITAVSNTSVKGEESTDSGTASVKEVGALARLILSLRKQPIPQEHAKTMPQCFAYLGSEAVDSFGKALKPSSAAESLEPHGFPYMRLLAKVDVAALMISLSAALETLDAATTRSEFDEQELVDMYATAHGVAVTLDAEASASTAGPAMTKAANNPKLSGLRGLHVNAPTQHTTDAFFESCATRICTSRLTFPWAIISGYISWADGKSRNRAVVEHSMCTLVAHQLKSGTPAASQQLRESLEAHNFWHAALLVVQKTGQSKTDVPFSQALTFYISTAKGTSAFGAKSSVALEDSKAHTFEFIALRMELMAAEDVSPDAPQHKELCHVLVSHVLSLASLDLERTATMVQAHLRGHLSAVIEATRMSPQVQLQLLEKVIAAVDADPVHELGEYMSPPDTLAYLRLLAGTAPKQILPFLTLHTNYDVTACIALCRDKGLSDATALLLERSGQPTQALALLLSDLSTRLRVAEADLAAQLDTPAGRNGPLLNLLSKTGEDRTHAIVSLPHYVAVRHTIECVSATCARNNPAPETVIKTPDYSLDEEDGKEDIVLAPSPVATPKTDAAQPELWFSALDHCIKEKQTLRAMQSASAEIVALICVQLVQVLLGEMLAVVPARVIVRRITAGHEHSSGRFSDFKDIFINMFRSYSEEDIVLDTTINMQHKDCHTLHRQKILDYSRGVRVHASGGALLPRSGGQPHISVIEPPGWRPGSGVPRPKPALTAVQTRVGSRSHLPKHAMRRALQSGYEKVNTRGMGDLRYSVTSSLHVVPPPFLMDLDDLGVEGEAKYRHPGSMPLEPESVAEYNGHDELINNFNINK